VGFVSPIPQTFKFHFFHFHWKKEYEKQHEARKGSRKQPSGQIRDLAHLESWMPARSTGQMTPVVGSLAISLTFLVVPASNFFLLCLF